MLLVTDCSESSKDMWIPPICVPVCAHKGLSLLFLCSVCELLCVCMGC